MKLGAFVLGYHGCDRKVGESLISGKTDFKASQNDHDWLGAGIYFWENNPKRAMQWAQFMSRHPKFNKGNKKGSAQCFMIMLEQGDFFGKNGSQWQDVQESNSLVRSTT